MTNKIAGLHTYKNVLIAFFYLSIFSGCAPTASFVSPNEMYRQNVTLYFRDQTNRTGLATISFENTFNSQIDHEPFIKFIPEGKTEEENINLSGISGYSKGADFYALKQLDYSLNNTNHLLFVKRITPENSKIDLYELYESGRGNYSGDEKYSYYLSFPGHAPLETFNTAGSTVIPLFDQKMSAMVEDCPSLAEKIRSKQPGYFISFTSFKTNQRRDVLLRIINEYNNCSK